jgi:uncharacterized protein YdcH (DUF465 family)
VFDMSEGERIEILKARHAELENELITEEHKIQPDHVAVSTIKKQKLLLKDQMARIHASL